MAINSEKNTRNSYTLSNEAYRKLEELCNRSCRSKSQMLQYMIGYFYDMMKQEEQKQKEDR